MTESEQNNPPTEPIAPPNEPNTPPAEPPKEPTTPAWFSQLPSELKADESVIKSYGNFKTIGEAIKAGMDYRKSQEGTIKVPTKDSTDDEVKAFFTLLGVPESADKYTIPDMDKMTPAERGAALEFQKVCHENGLSTQQATAQWALIKSMSQVGADMQTKALEDAKASFDSKLTAMYDHESEAVRQDMAKEAVGAFTKFATDTGLGKLFADTGLIYNPQVVKSIADYAKAHNPSNIDVGDTTVLKGAAKAKQGAFGDDYSDDFAAISRRK